MEDCYYSIREQFKALHKFSKEVKNAPEWIMKQTELIKDSTGKLYEYNNKLAFSKFIKSLSAEFKISTKEFKEAEKSHIQKVNDGQEIQNEGKSTSGESKTVIVEKWIRENYDLYFNVISHRYIGRKKGEPELKEIKLENLYHDLDVNHLKYSWSDLKILLRTDYIEPQNPFLNYFENLPPWDGKDYIGKLASYIKILESGKKGEERARFENQFQKMFVRSIACALEVSFNKHCFTLVSQKQHGGKSTFLRWLCPPELVEYYSENIGLTKDDRIALSENFWINIDELDTLGKYDVNSLKSLFSKDGFKDRLPYAERTEVLKRRCNFVASTNRKDFLSDETGSVRWICFNVDSINHNYNLDVNINDVWCQAYNLFKIPTYKYQFTTEEVLENEKANRQFFMRSVEMELIEKYYLPAGYEEIKLISKADINKGSEIKFMTATDIKEDLTIRSNIKDHLSNISIGKALKFLGFEQRSERFPDEESSKGYWIKENEDQKRWKKDNEWL